MKKTALASAISLAMISSSVWAVPCNVLGPTGQPIPPFDQEAGVVCSTTTVDGEFILDKSSIKAGETVNLAILGLNATGEVDRFGEDGGSILMAVVSTTQGLISVVNPPQGSPNSGQTPSDVIAEGSFVNRQGAPTNNPDELRTTRVVQLENGNGEINIYYPPNVNPTVGGRVTVKLQERESTANGGIRVNTIEEVVKTIAIAPPASNPFALDIVEFVEGFNDGAGVADMMPMDGIHGMMTAGTTGAGSEITINALNERAGGSVAVTLTPVGSGDEITTSGSMINGVAVVSLPSITQAGDYYIKATMTYTEGEEQKTVSSVDLETVDKVTVIPTGVPKSLSLSFNKERITQLGQGAVVDVDYLDEYGNTTTSRAGSSYTVEITEGSNNTATLTAVVDAFGNHSSIILGDAAGEISIATGTLAMTAKVASGLSPSSVTSLQVVDKVFNVTVLPGFAPGVELVANNQVEAVVVDKDPGSTNPVTITNTDTGETSQALREPTTGSVRAVFKQVGNGPYLVSDLNGEYAQTLVEGATIIPGTPVSLEVRNAHNEVVDSVLTQLLPDSSGLMTDIPEKAIRLFDQHANPVTGVPAGKFTLTTAVEGATVSYPVGSSATPSGTARVMVNYPISAEGTGEVPLTVNLTAPGFTDATTINTTLPELTTFTEIKAYVEQTTIPVNSRVAVSVELLDQNGDQVEGMNSIRIAINPEGVEGNTINAPIVREVMMDGSRGDLIAANKIVNFEDGKKVFEVNAGQTTGQFTLSFVDPTGTVEAATRTFTVTQVLENECTPSSLGGCPDEPSCNAVGGGYTGAECTAVPALGTLAIDNTAAFIDPVPAGALVKGGYSINGNAFVNPASATDTGARVKIVGAIEAADADIGAEGDMIVMYAGVELGGSLATAPIFILVNEATEIAQWDGTIENIPSFSTATLEEYNVLNIFDTGEGGFGIEGELYVLVAYRIANGNIVFGENLLQLEIDDPRI